MCFVKTYLTCGFTSPVLEQESSVMANNNYSMASLAWPAGQSLGEDSANLDYLLALSLQSDGDTGDLGGGEGALWTDVWDHKLGRMSNTGSLISPISAPNNYQHITTGTNTDLDQTGEILFKITYCPSLFSCENYFLLQYVALLCLLHFDVSTPLLNKSCVFCCTHYSFALFLLCRHHVAL